ncbi:tubulin binding cofactor A [Obba rivulosa]|uniref:Tubulin-specific chaperone A n=1 Tax=Obba rivulosa TaxID=1052685 RepID=A0A8E2B2H6_9APHY|nr:tubulin binding cofactor A [Obba rivulosa]
MSSDPTAALRRQLKIKTGAAKRLSKEHRSYQTEEEDLKRALDKFLADGAEEWDIKNARRMLEETQKMIADSASRLGTTVQELRDTVLAAEKNPALKDAPELAAAQEIIEEVSV